MATPPPSEPRHVIEPEALNEHGLDAGYAQLATAFNTEDTNAERRAARDTYAHRRAR